MAASSVSSNLVASRIGEWNFGEAGMQESSEVPRRGCDFDTESPAGGLPLRLPFPAPAVTATDVRTMLVAMLHEARAAS